MSTGARGNLASRVAGTSAPTSTSLRVPSGSPSRHCFVEGEPALLVEWRQTNLGWEGRVLSMTWIDAVGWATVERWLPARQISSA
jgi:hypothetical protein